MKNIILALVVLIVLSIFSSCENEKEDEIPEEGIPDIVPEDEIIKIPVVVHVINYAPEPFEISDDKIRSQIDVLNQDFRKQNSDWQKTPDEFIDLVADVGIEFYLATVDPEGNPTTGIIRTSSDVIGGDGDTGIDRPIEDLRLYFTDKGGQDAWPRDQYLNIWIADKKTATGKISIPGYANFPGCDKRIDGVVIDPRCFGTLPPLWPNHNLGRTATHEIGHWLNLRHVFGKNGACEDIKDDGDLVDDTPVQMNQRECTPTYPQYSCGSSDMFMNYMDYVYDEAMFMFTKGQKQRMRALFNKGGLRRDLYLNVREE